MCTTFDEERNKLQLKHFVQLVGHAFYEPKDYLFLDLLIKNTILSDEELGEMLHYENRHLRATATQFLKDKLIKLRIRSFQKKEGRTQKLHFYFIDFKIFVNVVKYKLLKMREKLEREERNGERASYVCTRESCQKTYTELDINHLMDIRLNQLICKRCQAIVDEKEDKDFQGATLVNNVSRLNLQLKPIYDILKQIDQFQIPLEMINPEIKGSFEPIAFSSSSLIQNNTHFYKKNTDTENHIRDIHDRNNYSQTSKKRTYSLESTQLMPAHINSKIFEEMHQPNVNTSSSITEVLYRGEYKSRFMLPTNTENLDSTFRNNPDIVTDSGLTEVNNEVKLGMYVDGTWHLLSEMNGNEILIDKMNQQEMNEYQELCCRAAEEYYY